MGDTSPRAILSVLVKCQVKCQLTYVILCKVLDFKIKQQGMFYRHVHKSMTYKEELEWWDLFSLEKLVAVQSTETNRHQTEAVYSNWKSLHWVCLRVSKTTNCKGWHNYTWYWLKNGERKWTDTTHKALKIHSSLFSMWFLKGLHRYPVYFEFSVSLWGAFWGRGKHCILS